MIYQNVFYNNVLKKLKLAVASLFLFWLFVSNRNCLWVFFWKQSPKHCCFLFCFCALGAHLWNMYKLLSCSLFTFASIFISNLMIMYVWIVIYIFSKAFTAALLDWKLDKQKIYFFPTYGCWIKLKSPWVSGVEIVLFLSCIITTAQVCLMECSLLIQPSTRASLFYFSFHSLLCFLSLHS